LRNRNKEVDSTTLHGKIMAGYQGWFMTPDDGGLNKWRHWANNEMPGDDTVGIDLWPDLSEFDEDELYPSGFTYYENGQTAGLYSNNNAKTVMRHMQWMKHYNIHGVFVQRFIIEAIQIRHIRDNVLQNVQKGAEAYGRVFANMYDISGWHEKPTLIDDIKNDWMHLVDNLKITESPRYLHHYGNPVLSIWGFGFNGRPSDPAKALELIEWLQNGAPVKYRACVMGGVNHNWRSSVENNDEWSDVYRAFDVISPWSVGRFANEADADNFRRKKIEPDLEMANDVIGNEYMPVVFPGFSFHNEKDHKTFNEIPRQGGTFLWRQLYNAIDSGNTMVYVAMFDELDEGTAIFKLAETKCDMPVTGKFVSLDEDDGYDCVPNDWYMRLVGTATFLFGVIDKFPDTMPRLPRCRQKDRCDRTYSPTASPSQALAAF